MQSRVPKELTHHQITTRQPRHSGKDTQEKPALKNCSLVVPRESVVTGLPMGKRSFSKLFGAIYSFGVGRADHILANVISLLPGNPLGEDAGDDSENTSLVVRSGGQN